MPNHVYLHPTLPALIRVYGSEFDVQEHALALGYEDAALLDVQPQKVYYITDIREIHIGFEDMVQWAAMASRGANEYRHPNVIENLLVVEQRMVELAAQNLKSPSLGSIKIRTLQTLEDALAYIEEQQERSR